MSDFGSAAMEDAFTEQSLVALQGWGQVDTLGKDQDQSKRARLGSSKRDRQMADREPPLRDLIRAMGQLMLRHDQDLQTSAMQDTFILFLVPSPEGSIPLLQSAHRQWTDLKEKTTTLRTFLILALLRELQRRLLKLMACSDQDPLKTTMVKNGILLEDLTWPYTQWDQANKKLVLSKTKTPMTMAAAQELLEELLTLVKEEGAIQRFHSLSKQESTKSQPWKLQVGQRNDRLHHLLTTSCHLSLWQIAGIQMKPHTLKASPLAVKVKDMLQSL